MIDSVRQIRQEPVFGKGGVVSSILTGGTSNPAENQQFSERPRSPSVRHRAERCANMRGLVRKICGRASGRRLTKPAPFRVPLRRPLSNQIRKTVDPVNRYHARAFRGLGAAAAAWTFVRTEPRPKRHVANGFAPNVMPVSPGPHSSITQEGSARLFSATATTKARGGHGRGTVSECGLSKGHLPGAGSASIEFAGQPGHSTGTRPAGMGCGFLLTGPPLRSFVKGLVQTASQFFPARGRGGRMIESTGTRQDSLPSTRRYRALTMCIDHRRQVAMARSIFSPPGGRLRRRGTLGAA